MHNFVLNNVAMPDQNNFEEEDDELPGDREIAVGGGAGQLMNIVVLGLSLFGVLYGLVMFLTARPDAP